MMCAYQELEDFNDTSMNGSINMLRSAVDELDHEIWKARTFGEAK